MSPEQVRESKAADVRSDVWSLGVILYELLSDTIPFGGDGEAIGEVYGLILHTEPVPLRTRRADLPAALEAVVHKCLRREPSQRLRERRRARGKTRSCRSPRACRPRMSRPFIRRSRARTSACRTTTTWRACRPLPPRRPRRARSEGRRAGLRPAPNEKATTVVETAMTATHTSATPMERRRTRAILWGGAIAFRRRGGARARASPARAAHDVRAPGCVVACDPSRRLLRRPLRRPPRRPSVWRSAPPPPALSATAHACAVELREREPPPQRKASRRAGHTLGTGTPPPPLRRAPRRARCPRTCSSIASSARPRAAASARATGDRSARSGSLATTGWAHLGEHELLVHADGHVGARVRLVLMHAVNGEVPVLRVVELEGQGVTWSRCAPHFAIEGAQHFSMRWSRCAERSLATESSVAVLAGGWERRAPSLPLSRPRATCPR